CTFEDEGTVWGVEAPNAVIEVSDDEPAEPLPENLENIAAGKTYTVEGSNPRGDGYDDNETGKLTNGEAVESEATQENLGFNAIDGNVTVVIDLGEVKDFVAMTADTIYGAWGIAAPTGVSFAVSEDGENFSDPVAGKLTETAGSGDWIIQLYTAQGEFTGRYVKVVYSRDGAGHLWTSEIQVLAEAAAPVEESSEPAPAESEPATPTTGDAGIIALAVISVIALGGAVVVKKVK
ncbi:MAG: discoidin domain-containing protein, partial [Clostridia bacterium]|nr:discoidin domain-containing protein [Clostridia bacterium]